jgi:hypothetical protein
MSVRVNKSSFSIREKLSELERPIGLKGSELMRAETAQEARDFVSAGRKNIVINGDMKIHQRGGTITVTNSDSAIYGLDRFKTWCYPGGVSAVFTLQQATSNPPTGFSNYLRWTTTTAYAVSGNANSFFGIQHAVEGNNLTGIDIGKSTAKPLTVSFWVRSSIAGKYTFSIYYVGANPTNYLKYYVINSVNTWEYKTITLPPQTSTATGELTGNDTGIYLSWNMGMGTSYGSTSTTEGYINNKYELGGSVRIIENTNATFDLTGVQLEVGKNATEFEHRSYGEELALCQRYFQTLNDTDTFNSSSGPYGSTANVGWQYSASSGSLRVYLPVSMRTNPTATVIGTPTSSPGADGTIGTYGDAAWMPVNSIDATETTKNSVRINVHNLNGSGKDAFGLYFYGSKTTSTVILNAEL